MTTSLVLLACLIATSSAFLLEGLGLGGLGPKQCCCQPPPPPPPCGGGGYASGGYEAPPPPPPPPMYPTGYRNKRSNKDRLLDASSGDQFCNSVAVRDIIKAGMSEDEKESRETIITLLKTQLDRQFVVVCSKKHFDFQASADSEFCSITSKSGMTCSTFVF
ncbi:unnamed protein product [Caenorhabditis bovis]|uniref:Ground-like domain-containing protein n=1 Tax=Caenorhabditis bovis TaxID=2654633 RepID=A0A8S1F036_9PELO|nr:unnamed protein product [Caenorhabditis bovis]